MIKIYFTFGSDPRYPFGINDYVVAHGIDVSDCLRKFREKYPNPRPDHERILNCAFFYTETKFKKECAKYYGPEPAEVIE